jgi:hypothetical protein
LVRVRERNVVINLETVLGRQCAHAIEGIIGFLSVGVGVTREWQELPSLRQNLAARCSRNTLGSLASLATLRNLARCIRP